MSIFETLMGQQSTAFRTAESANLFSQMTKVGKIAADMGAGLSTQVLAAYIGAISSAQKSFAIALEPASAMAAQLQLFDSKILAALTPIKEATENMSALSAAFRINTSFHDLGKAPAFAQIRLFEKITGDRLLKFEESDLLKKTGQSNSFIPINSVSKVNADFVPFLPTPGEGSFNYFEERTQSKIFSYQTNFVSLSAALTTHPKRPTLCNKPK